MPTSLVGSIPGALPGALSGVPYVPLASTSVVLVTSPTTYKYVIYHPLTNRQLMGNLKLVGAQWSQTIDGNGTLSAKVVVPEDAQAVAVLQTALQLDNAIYVIDNHGTYVWGGWIEDVSWDPANGDVEIAANEWRAWFYMKMLTPSLTPPYANVTYAYAQKDQLIIARDLISKATSGGIANGCPTIRLGTETSGPSPIPIAAKRDLNFLGSDFKFLGNLIDSMAHRDGGFEWILDIRQNNLTGAPELWFATYYPQRGRSKPITLLKHTGGDSTVGNSGNIISYAPYRKSSKDIRQRIWASGSGVPGQLIYTQDAEPALSTKYFLMKEDSWSNSSIVNTSTLASNARRERLFRKPGIDQLDIVVNIYQPDVSTYGIGDRVRLVITDRWLNVDLPAVRIVARTISPDENQVSLTLDLNDATPPESDAAGSI